MNRAKQIVIFVFWCCTSLMSVAETADRKLDSLKKVLSSVEINDSIKLKLQLEIALGSYLSSPDSCLKYATKALKTAEIIGDKKSGSLANYYLANYFVFEKADYQKGMVHNQEVIDLCILLNDSVGLGKAVNLEGVAYYYKGEYDKSIEFYLQSMRIKEDVGDTLGVANTIGNIGMIYKLQGKKNQALAFYSQALEIMIKLNDNKGISNMLNSTGTLYADMDSLVKSKDCYLRALKIARKSNDKALMAICLDNIGNLFSYNNVLDSSLFYGAKAMEIRESIGDVNGMILSYINMSADYQSMGDVKTALEFLKNAEKLAKNAGNRWYEQEIHFAFSDSYEETGDYKKALSSYKRYAGIKDSLFNESKSKEIGKLEAQFEMEKKLEQEDRIRNDELRVENEKKSRRDNLQYSGILVFVLILFAVVFMSGKFSMSEKVAEGLIFFTFLLVFEFCLVLLDPFIDNWSSGEPLYKLLFNAVLAALIFPLHAFFESRLKKRLIKIIKVN
ncbi:MAG: tetratricopeptide repeat protein [Flavobacteriales bacterium]|nr:tetratricopeptide repeat protein [Flavobacteriales bacterium]